MVPAATAAAAWGSTRPLWMRLSASGSDCEVLPSETALFAKIDKDRRERMLATYDKSRRDDMRYGQCVE